MQDLKAGAYRLSNPQDSEVDIIVLVTGKAPFLKIDTIFDNKTNSINYDNFKGLEPESLHWEKL